MQSYLLNLRHHEHKIIHEMIAAKSEEDITTSRNHKLTSNDLFGECFQELKRRGLHDPAESNESPF